MFDPKTKPVDWAVFRHRGRWDLFTLACLVHRVDPRAVLDDAHLAIRKQGGTASDVLNDPKHAAAMLYASPEMFLIEPVGATLERMKTATGLPESGAIACEQARTLAESLGLSLPPELSAAPRQQAPEPQDAPEPSAAPVVAESASGEPAGPPPLTTGDIAFCFDGLRWKTEEKWKAALGKGRDWIEACVAVPAGGRGRGAAPKLWNPVLLAAALVRDGHVKANSMRARFQTEPLLMPWLDAWKTYEADYLDND